MTYNTYSVLYTFIYFLRIVLAALNPQNAFLKKKHIKRFKLRHFVLYYI